MKTRNYRRRIDSPTAEEIDESDGSKLERIVLEVCVVVGVSHPVVNSRSTWMYRRFASRNEYDRRVIGSRVFRKTVFRSFWASFSHRDVEIRIQGTRKSRPSTPPKLRAAELLPSWKLRQDAVSTQ